MRRASALIVSIVCGLVAAGCGTGGAWSNTGFSQTTYGWKASYPPGQQSLLGTDWRVDNWERTMETPPGATEQLAEKTGPGFMLDVAEDGNDDGRIDSNERDPYYFYDLKLRHVPDDAAIWIKTRELTTLDARKSLELLVERFLAGWHMTSSLSGMGFVLKGVTYRAETRLGSNRALAVSITVNASLPGGELRRIDLLATKFVYSKPDMPGPLGVSTAFMLIGYVNTVSRFDVSRGDLDKLVARLTWSPVQPLPPGARGIPADADEEGDFRWTVAGFEQRRFGWKASYAPGGQNLVSPDWRLQSAAGAGGYTGRADLSFENVHNNGFIWTDTATLSPDAMSKDLDVLFEDYVGRLTSVGFGGRAVISSREEIKLGTYPSVSALIEREPTAAEREGRVRTIATKLRLVVAKFEYIEGPASLGAARERRVAFVVLGYANDSTRFDLGLEDFAAFLGRITWPAPPPGAKPDGSPHVPAKPPAKPDDPKQPTLQT